MYIFISTSVSKAVVAFSYPTSWLVSLPPFLDHNLSI